MSLLQVEGILQKKGFLQGKGAFKTHIFKMGGNSYRDELRQLLSDGSTAAWYQPGIGVTGTLNASLWANWVNGTAGTAGDLAQATPANQSIYLPWIGANYAYLPAVAGNTLTSPNQSVTGSFSITFNIALNDYTPAADVTLFDKTSGNNGFAVKWLTTDKIRLVVGDGVGLTNVDVVAVSSFTNGSRHTATIAWADGVGATFSYDSVQSGSQVAAAKTLTNAAVDMTIGGTTSIGKVYRLQVGSLYDMDAALTGELTANGATFTGGAGETWTLNNTGATPAMLVASPSLLSNGTAHWMQSGAFTFAQPELVIAVARPITWIDGGVLVDGTTSSTGSISQDSGSGGVSPDIHLYAGTQVAKNSNFVLGAYAIVSGYINGASSFLQINNTTATTGNPGASNMSGLTIGRLGSTSAGYGNYQYKEIILRSAYDAATFLRIKQRLAALHGITL